MFPNVSAHLIQFSLQCCFLLILRMGEVVVHADRFLPSNPNHSVNLWFLCNLSSRCHSSRADNSQGSGQGSSATLCYSRNVCLEISFRKAHSFSLYSSIKAVKTSAVNTRWHRGLSLVQLFHPPVVASPCWDRPIDWAWICSWTCWITQLLPAAAILPQEAKSKFGHFLWLNFFGWQVPWSTANTNQCGNQLAGKFRGLRSVGSKWAWNTKRYDNIDMRSSQVHNHIPPFLPSRV